jgi:hypothetical protein
VRTAGNLSITDARAYGPPIETAGTVGLPTAVAVSARPAAEGDPCSRCRVTAVAGTGVTPKEIQADNAVELGVGGHHRRETGEPDPKAPTGSGGHPTGRPSNGRA